jgi:Ca2+-transporting ATPase
MAFATIVLANLALILTNRSWTHTIFGTFRIRNNSFWWILGGALLALSLVLYVPQLRSFFQFSALQPIDLLICIVAAVVSIVWFEVFKFVKRYIPKK